MWKKFILIFTAFVMMLSVSYGGEKTDIQLFQSDNNETLTYSFEADTEFVMIKYKTPFENGAFVDYGENGQFSGKIQLQWSQGGGKATVSVANLKEKTLGESTIILNKNTNYVQPAGKSTGKVKDFILNDSVTGVNYSFSINGADFVYLQVKNKQQSGKFAAYPDENGFFQGEINLPYTYARGQVTVKISDSKGNILAEAKARKDYEAPPMPEKTDGRLNGVTVCIDPGHQENGKYLYEPLGPGLEGKHSTSYGMGQGEYTKRYEAIVTLETAMALRDELIRQGANVVMTRTKQMELVTNLERSSIANDSNADIMLRLHCDLRENKNKRGFSVYAPLHSDYAKMVADSKEYRAMGEILMNSMKEACGYEQVDKTGLVILSDQFVGNNWAKMPCFLIEMGMMSNIEDDYLLSTPQWQQRLAKGMTEGVYQIAKFRGIIK